MTLVEGDHFTWRNPCGIGGVLATGYVVRMPVDSEYLELYVDPNQRLREISEEIRKLNEAFPSRYTAHMNVSTDGLCGNGGQVIMALEGFRRAILNGDLVKT